MDLLWSLCLCGCHNQLRLHMVSGILFPSWVGGLPNLMALLWSLCLSASPSLTYPIYMAIVKLILANNSHPLYSLCHLSVLVDLRCQRQLRHGWDHVWLCTSHPVPHLFSKFIKNILINSYFQQLVNRLTCEFYFAGKCSSRKCRWWRHRLALPWLLWVWIREDHLFQRACSRLIWTRVQKLCWRK